MIPINLKAIVGRLNDTCRSALEGAAGLCLSKTNYNLEIEHWLCKLVEASDTDAAFIFKHFQVDALRLRRDLMSAVDRFKVGNSRPPALSPDTIELARDAWLLASVEFSAEQVRSGHLIASLLLDDARGRLARDLSAEFNKIAGDALLKQYLQICADSHEQASATRAGAVAAAAAPGEGGAPRSGGMLDRFTLDLTAQARAGKIDPVRGRDVEIRQLIDILMRRRQNNPIITGEAGVGKTAVVEGFADRIARGDVPPPLANVAVRSLDLGALQAGASIKGEFENRLRGVIDETKASSQPIILFIDEAHMLIGAGGQAGQGDAANLLKPALARGELRTIAATTWAEYKKYFEKDPALTRRFQVVKVDEPAEADAISMMRSSVESLERHHGVRILDEAVTACVTLSHRYISGRLLPDKAVSLIDTACARVAIGRKSTPPLIEDLRRAIDLNRIRIDVLERELAVGGPHAAELERVRADLARCETELADAESRCNRERELVEQILELRRKLENAAVPKAAARSAAVDGAAKPGAASPAASSASAGPAAGAAPSAAAPAGAVAAAGTPAVAPPLTDAERAQSRAELDRLSGELRTLQGERPLMQPFVDRQVVGEVVSAWTGIPVGRMMTDQVNLVLRLHEKLEERIVGQSHALDAIAKVVRTSRADLGDPRKPVGVFLFVGPSGVGKTETAIALAELLYGGEQNLNVINMSEYKEEHKVSLLMGSPPGYVGYGEGGVLTEAVRRRPYSVLLLDEMEKAHPGVQDVFYQVFDKGMMRDGEGRDINFKNTVIIMTSNAASAAIMKMAQDPETRPTPEALAAALHPELMKTFKPAFLGRCTIVPYFPLSDEVLNQIIVLKLGKIVHRVRATYGAALSYDPGVVAAIKSRCTEVESGARNVDHIVSHTLLPDLAAEVLARMAQGEAIQRVTVGLRDDQQFEYRFGNATT
ncbi:MAG: type VI secretion system ATPase TssH [Phycisphaerae bacterium]